MHDLHPQLRTCVAFKGHCFVPEGATESSQGELYQKRSRGELKEATGRLPTIGNPCSAARAPISSRTGSSYAVLANSGEVALHRVVHPPAQPGL
jgi:hypothetical protein